MKLVLATHNPGKVKEFRDIFSGTGIDIMSLDDVGITEDPVEDGATFEENAFKKADFAAQRVKEWVMADDSGLCVKALGGAPGVFSARWAGEGATGEEIRAFTLEKLKDVPDGERQAWFECAIALISPEGKQYSFSGRVDSVVARESRGTTHPKLPYDAVLVPDGFNGKTFAEISAAEKNKISARGRAAEQVKEFFANLLPVKRP